jgi:hypothetical protein
LAEGLTESEVSDSGKQFWISKLQEFGMPESLLSKKMNLKAGQRAIILNAPEGYLQELQPLPDQVRVSERIEAKADWVQVFVKSKAELENIFPRLLKILKSESLLWITFPKGTSKIQTDLTRDKGWGIVQASDLKWIKLISVNGTWSAFSLRPYKPGEAKQSFR